MNPLFAMTDSAAALLAGIYEPLLPEIVLVITACVVFLGATFRPDRNLWGLVSLVGLAGAGVALYLHGQPPAQGDQVFILPVTFDGLAQFTRWLALAAGVLIVLMSWNELSDQHAGDYQACLLILLAGVSFVGLANDLTTMFLALEMVSIPTYILLYLPKHDRAAQEASLKYFLLSIFSSGMLLFGFSYLYGLAGSTNLSVILNALYQSTPPVLAMIALVWIVAGLSFRITAVPFHFYAPDVYQGTSNISAGLLATIPKVVGFVALIRLMGFAPASAEVMGPSKSILGSALSANVPILFWILAAANMTLGNFLALLQTNLRRMLAYSSIAHSGYMLIAISTAGLLHKEGKLDGIESILYYLIAYGAASLGMFAILAHFNRPERPIENIDDLAGLSKDHPLLAFTLAILFFSLIGIPLTTGFTGKGLIFFGAMAVTDHPWLYRSLLVVAALNAAVGGWYYLRVIAVLYFRTSVKPIQTSRNLPGLVAIGLALAVTVGLAFPPGLTWIRNQTTKAARIPGAEEKGEGARRVVAAE